MLRKLIMVLGLALVWSARAEEAPKTPPVEKPAEKPAKPELKLPWHLADVWWTFAAETPHFESLEMDVTLDRDIPSTINFYIAPCGIGELSGQKFYGGMQTNANGWPGKKPGAREFIGKGGIFSRWGKDKLSTDWARGADKTHFEAAGYEGDFVSVRRPFEWTKGKYTWTLLAGDVETVEGKDYTWVSCMIRSQETGNTRYIGSLKFEGKDLTFWKRHAAFVEVYSTAQIPKSEIPEITVTFGYPRINGAKPKFVKASVVHPGPGEQSASPDCATAEGEGENIVVKVGKIFERDAKDRKHGIELKF